MTEFRGGSLVRAVPRCMQLRRLSGVEIYAAAVFAAAGALAAAFVLGGWRITAPPWALLALAVVAVFAERQSVRVTSHTWMSASFFPILFAAVVFGPLTAMAVGACAVITDFRRPIARWTIWTAQRSLAAGFAGFAAAGITAPRESLARLLAAAAAVLVIEAGADLVLMSLTALLRKNSVAETRRSVFRLQLAGVPIFAPVMAVLAFAYEHLSPWTMLLFFVPAFAAQHAFRLYQEQRELAHELLTANQRLERANVSFATALVATLDARDRYTAGHSASVAIYARDIAARMGLSEAEQNSAHLCGLVHDIGKIGLPPGLLEKPGALTLEERRTMEQHAAIGEGILLNVDDYAEVAKIVRHHHERIDGFGYPDRLRGDAIPLLSRIIAVADAYDAMTSDRPYRDAMPSRVARLRLAQAVETQFDTTVVAAFEAVLAGATEAYRSGSAPVFAREEAELRQTPRVTVGGV